jgi:hypothetical protein
MSNLDEVYAMTIVALKETDGKPEIQFATDFGTCAEGQVEALRADVKRHVEEKVLPLSDGWVNHEVYLALIPSEIIIKSAVSQVQKTDMAEEVE